MRALVRAPIRVEKVRVAQAELVEGSGNELGNRFRSEDAGFYELGEHAFLLRIEPYDNLHVPTTACESSAAIPAPKRKPKKRLSDRILPISVAATRGPGNGTPQRLMIAGGYPLGALRQPVLRQPAHKQNETDEAGCEDWHSG